MQALKSKIIMLLFFVSCIVFAGSAQTIAKGIIKDGDLNEPIIGANVVVKGDPTNGTITDINGHFNLKVNKGDILIISYIGMLSKEISIIDNKEIEIQLFSNSKQLDQVVVIGYGTVKKSDLTGSIAVVDTKELNKMPSTSAAQALQGKAAGVIVSQTGEPGGGATIRVRGVGSISEDSQPIYVVDGIKVSNISGIQPQEIESFQVLKDASAAAIYGANGANGVVIITTKRGKSGKPQVTFNSYVTYNIKPREYDVMNAQEYADFYSATKYKSFGLDKTYVTSDNLTKANPAYALSPEFRQTYYGSGWQTGTNWQDYTFKNSINQSYNLSVSGGGDNSNFSVSFGYTNEDGTVIKTNAERLRIRANSDFRLSKYVKVGENFSANRSIKETPITIETSLYDLNVSPLMKVYNSALTGGYESYQSLYWLDSNNELTNIGTASSLSYKATLNNDKPNPIASAMLSQNKTYGIGTSASIYLQVDFTDWLMFKLTPSIDAVTSRSKYWQPNFEGNRSPGSANLRENYNEYIGYNLEGQLLFKKKFNEKHNVQATLVYNLLSTESNGITGNASEFPYEDLNTFSNATGSKSLTGSSADYRMLSYLGRIIYDYKSKYFVTVSGRSDGVSVFAPGYRRGNFFSGSLAWNVTEDFFKNIKQLDYLKVRTGWGQTGNSNIGGGFQYVDNISNTQAFSPVFGVNQTIATAQWSYIGFASKQIHWESAEMTNIGIDYGIFKTKLTGSIEYYNKYVDGLLVKVPVSMSFGHLPGKNGQPWYNVAKLTNQGLELTMQWHDQIKNFEYGLSGSLTTVKNRVNYLPVPNITDGNNRTMVGQPVGSLYGYVAKGIIQLNDDYYTRNSSGEFQKDANGNYTGYKFATQESFVPQPGDIQYADLNADGKVDTQDKTIIGTTIPTTSFTLGFNCSYKNFDLNLFINSLLGFDVYNAQRASLSSMNSSDMDHNKLRDYGLNYWSLDNPTTKYVRVDPSNTNKNDQISTFWIEDGSFVRIKDVQIGYTVPNKYIKQAGMSSLRLYLSGSNLYNFTSYTGRDSESTITGTDIMKYGSDNGVYTMPRSTTFGIQIGF